MKAFFKSYVPNVNAVSPDTIMPARKKRNVFLINVGLMVILRNK